LSLGGFVAESRAVATKWVLFTVAVLAALLAVVLPSGSADAATPTIANGSNWLLQNFSLGETNNGGNHVWLSLAVKHDVGRKVTGLKIDDDWDGTDNTTSKAVKTVTAQQPSLQGGYDYSRVNYDYAFPTSGTGMSCGAFGIGGTNKATKPIRVRAILDDGTETATSSTNINFTRADCSGGEDFPYIYSRSQTATSVAPGGSVTFTFKGDDSDSTGNADFAGVNWRLRRVSDGATTAAQVKCYSSPFDNTDKTLAVTFPNRGRWVVEAELLNNSGCGTNNNAGSWAYIGAVDVNTAAATSPTATLSATRPQLNGNTTVSASFADGSDNGQGGRVQDLEWDLDNNTTNGVGGFEATTLGDWSSGLTSPQTKTVSTSGMAPGLHTVRVRVGDNGALVGADTVRATKIATATYLVDTPPVAEDQSVIARAGTAKQITLTGTDVDGDSLTYSNLTQPAHGTVTLSGSVATYTADPDYAGPDSFSFQANDGYGGNDTATVSIDVAPQTVIDDPAPTAVAVDHAEFNFSSPTADASFECRFDPGEDTEWEACESPFEATGLAAGPHVFQVRATAAGITDPSPATHTVSVYLTPPRTTIDSGPEGATGSDHPVFQFSSDVAGTGFECLLDSGAGEDWEDCDSPMAYADLGEGTYTFSVRAVDPVGHVDPDPPSHVFSVDLTGPDVTIDSGPSGPINQASADFAFSSSEAGADFECKFDDGGWETCESPAHYGGVDPGEHSFAVRAVDSVGNPSETPASRTWTVDLTDPTVTITSAPPASTTQDEAEFEFEADETVDFECRLDGGDWEACESPLSTTVTGEGSHTFQVRGTDPAGNVGASDEFEWFIDTIAPHTTIDTAPAPVSNVASPQVEFSADEAGVAFECRIDSDDDADWQACASPLQIDDLADGEHEIEVRATDAAGNVEPAPATAGFTVDTAAPDVSLDTAPPAATGSPSATFEFSSTDAGATFECRIDGESGDPFSECESPKAYLGLTDGQHHFEVRAKDDAGNRSEAVDHSWTVDVTAPAIDITSKPADPTAEGSATFAFEADDAGATFECRIDSADEDAWVSCESPLDLTDLSEGRHTFEARAADTFGNVTPEPAAWSWTVDQTAPSATIGSAPPEIGNSPQASFEFSADESGSSFECRVDSTEESDWASCGSPFEATGLGEGQHRFQVRATDQAGNQGPAESHEWTIDLTKPVVTIDDHPVAFTNATTADFDFSSDEGDSVFQCDLDNAGWEDCAPPTAYDDLTEGVHAFRVRAIDVAGNVSDAKSFSWQIILTPPQISIDSGPDALTNSPSADIEFSSNDNQATFECRLDSSAPEGWNDCSSPFHADDLTDGSHRFEVRATDGLGNVSDEASHEWTVDLTAPAVTVDSAPSGAVNSAAATIAFSSDDEDATFECNLDGAGPEDCTSPVHLTGLGEGSHTFRVRAIDPAGNISAYTGQTWTIDLTDPVVTIDQAPPALGNSDTATIAFSADESVTFECDLDGAGWQPCSSPAVFDSLAEGEHRLALRATDAAGNLSFIAIREWTIDLTAPTASIDSTPPALTKQSDATFEFSSDDDDAVFECRLDSGSWDECASPRELTGLSHGDHRYEVRAIDQAGNTGPAASHDWTVDLVAPSVSITAQPDDLTNQTTAGFEFSSDDEDATFECRLDDDQPGEWSACASPASFEDLGEGSHTLRIRATDPAGNTGLEANGQWTIDVTPPTLSFDSAPPAASGLATAHFEFSSNEPGTGFECRLDEDSWSECDSPVNLTGLSDGPHGFEVRGTDPAGNPTEISRDWTVDTAAPVVSIDTAPAALTNQATADFEFSSDEPGSTFECRIDDGGWDACTSPAHVTGLGEGSHTFRVRASDAVGNVSEVESHTWTVDLTSPVVTIDQAPPALGNSATAGFEFSADEDATFQCDLDDTGWEACTSPVSFDSLGEGGHSLGITAIDAAGNVSEVATRQWTVDLTAPTATIDSAPPALTKQADATFEFSAGEAGSTFECRLDSGSWTACTSPRQLTGLGDGSHRFEVRASDPAGNVGPAVSKDWTVDLVAPSASITAGPAALGNQSTADFEFDSDDADATFECRLDDDGWDSCVSPAHLSGLIEGQHQFRVRATDEAGNTGTEAARQWTIDLTAPTLGFDSAPAAATASDSAEFTFDSDESGTAFECRIDDGDWGSCTSPVDLTDLGDGDHEFSLRGTDPAGNQTVVSHGWTVDTVAPVASFDAAPGAIVNQASTAFEFSSNENDSSFECRLDDQDWDACTSPVHLSDLAEGSHTFRVRATDAVGNVGEAISHTWTVDLTSPVVTIESGPAASTNQTGAEFTFSSDKPDSTFECRIDSADPGGWAACSSPQAYASLSEGQHRFEVRAADDTGNLSQTVAYEWTIDSVVSTAAITGGPEGAVASAKATFTFTAGGPGAIQCRTDSDDEADWKPCASPLKLAGLDQGPHRLQVRTVGQVSGPGPVATRQWTVDTVAPQVTVSSGPDSRIRTDSARFEFATDDGSAALSCRIDSSAAADWNACTSPFEITGLGDGPHTLEIRATDEAGNYSVTTRQWTVDTLRPTVTITAHPQASTTDTAAEFTFVANRAGKFVCSQDDGPWIACASAFRIADLQVGGHSFRVKVTDEFGEQSEVASYQWSVAATGLPGEPKAKPTIKVRKTTKVSRSGLATVASVTCPDGTCQIKVPKAVKVKIANRRYSLKVKAPKKLGTGKTATIKLSLPKAARKALGKRRATARLTLKVTSSNGTSAQKKITAKLVG